MEFTQDVDDGQRRRRAYTSWATSIDNLVQASNAYVDATSEIFRACPLNDSAPLVMSAPDNESSLSVRGAFKLIEERMTEVALVEYKVQRSTKLLLERRNKMARISSVSRLPAELLRKIFLCVKEKDTPRTREWVDDDAAFYGTCDMLLPDRRIAMLRPELVLTWVSCLWRSLALNIPELWSVIDFYKEHPPFHRSTKWLIRSQEANLRIQIHAENIPRHPFVNKDVYMISAIGTVLPMFWRWGELSIHVNTIKELRQCFDAMTHPHQKSTQVRGVRSLSLRTDMKQTTSYLFDGELSKLWAQTFLRLQSLSLRGVVVHWTSPWLTNLRSLTIEFQEGVANTAPGVRWATRPLTDTFLTILRGCPLLEVLDLAEFRYQDVNNLTRTSVFPHAQRTDIAHLRNLHTLKIRKPHGLSLFHLLNSILADSLETFFCDIRDIPYPMSQAALVHGVLPFLQRYSHPASTIRVFWLAITSRPDSEEEILDVLKTLPKLDELILEQCPVRDLILSSFCPTANPTCPRLKVLRLIDCEQSLTELVEIIEGRLQVARGRNTPTEDSMEYDAGMEVCALETLEIRRSPTSQQPRNEIGDEKVTRELVSKLRGMVRTFVGETVLLHDPPLMVDATLQDEEADEEMET
ncbi:hypothetical protein FRB99_005568 [Tulasnella sp. 403]|nr:hypothetical protein FRB99_005568 [Tulasnella sp. 403]